MELQQPCTKPSIYADALEILSDLQAKYAYYVLK